jgi:hypothetical protein
MYMCDACIQYFPGRYSENHGLTPLVFQKRMKVTFRIEMCASRAPNPGDKLGQTALSENFWM